MAVTTETFGTLKDGREAHLFTISTSAGSSVTLTDFGAAVVKTIVPDGILRQFFPILPLFFGKRKKSPCVMYCL